MEESFMKTQRKSLVNRFTISILICGLIVFWGSQIFGEEWTTEQKEVWKVIENAWESLKKGDVKGHLADYHDDAVQWGIRSSYPIADLKVLEKRYKWWEENGKDLTINNEPHTILIKDNVAVVFYSSNWKVREISARGRVCDTLIKQDNKWKILGVSIASCDKPVKCD